LAEQRLWEFIKFSDDWANADTSIVDDLSASWFARKKVLQKANSADYIEFMERLKREHAIETGVVERLYDLDRGVTHTLIEKGISDVFLSHNDSDIPKAQLMNHLKDHKAAIDFVFDVVANQRPFSVSFVKELHSLVARSQSVAKGVDQFGNEVEIPLERGVFKTKENNPSREDGMVIKYCPPDHVSSEMDSLISIYDRLEAEQRHPVIIAAWFHHAFTQIHPFQDGNGRVARLLTSLILIKHDYFPFTVAREARLKYFDALEAADQGKPQEFVDFISREQKRRMEEALGLREVKSTSLDTLIDVLANKFDKSQWDKQELPILHTLNDCRIEVFEISQSHIHKLVNVLNEKLQNNIKIETQTQIIDRVMPSHDMSVFTSYAQHHSYNINAFLPIDVAVIALSPTNMTTLNGLYVFFCIHHYGYGNATIAIGTVLMSLTNGKLSSVMLDIPPHILSILEGIDISKKTNIEQYIDDSVTVALAQIANEIN
jgi:Fic family protein